MCNVKKQNNKKNNKKTSKQPNKQPEIRKHVLHINKRWLLRMLSGFLATSTTKTTLFDSCQSSLQQALGHCRRAKKRERREKAREQKPTGGGLRSPAVFTQLFSMRFPYYLGALKESHLQCVLFEFPLHKSLTMMTSSPIHSSQFYIYSLLFVVGSLEAEDKTEAGLRTSTFELWSK